MGIFFLLRSKNDCEWLHKESECEDVCIKRNWDVVIVQTQLVLRITSIHTPVTCSECVTYLVRNRAVDTDLGVNWAVIWKCECGSDLFYLNERIGQ
jgi:RNase P subunit RPR2